MKKAVIVLPTYNEAHNITKLINQIFDIAEGIPNWEIHIVVVDSDSPDHTGKIVEDLYNSDKKKYRNLHVIHTRKEGLGKAYIEGFQTSLEKLKPYVLFEMDADLSHDPKKIPEFLKAIERGADFVIGSRYRPGGSIPADWGLHRKVFSFFANWFIRIGYMKFRITDWTTGYRAIKAWVLRDNLAKLEGYTGYVFQVALLDNAILSKARIGEVPINFKDRKEGVSKINSLEYIIQTFIYVIQHSPFVKFCVVGGIGFIVDFSLAYLFIHSFNISKVLSNMMSAEIAIISNFMLNNYWSFAHKRIRRSTSLLFSLLKFNLVSSGSVVIQGVGMWLALTIFGDRVLHLSSLELHTWIIYKILIIILVVIPYSYFFYNKIVWKDN
ncbi:glycosyltransferase family 2 protein [Candidatus Roizmanbacteria bacterium]|nr:MAG: glycosyltransferase family 2 protein [Candidatus Roizmanbacteria bacterium]